MKRFLFLLSLTFSVFLFSQTVRADIPQPDNVAYAVPAESAGIAATPDYSAPVQVVYEQSAIPDGIFSTFLALAAFIPVAAQFLRKRLIPNATGIWVQAFSWAVGIAVTLAGWLLHLGFLDGLSIWLALLYAFGACLAANGVFDTGLITALFGLFGKKVATDK
jgi:hypothetical protein